MVRLFKSCLPLQYCRREPCVNGQRRGVARCYGPVLQRGCRWCGLSLAESHLTVSLPTSIRTSVPRQWDYSCKVMQGVTLWAALGHGRIWRYIWPTQENISCIWCDGCFVHGLLKNRLPRHGRIYGGGHVEFPVLLQGSWIVVTCNGGLSAVDQARQLTEIIAHHRELEKIAIFGSEISGWGRMAPRCMWQTYLRHDQRWELE